MSTNTRRALIIIVALATSFSASAAEDLAPIKAEITKRHDEALKRLQDWIKLPSIAAENLNSAEGAEYNARLCGEVGQDNSDNSKGIHNPFLCEALLTATITYVRSYYGFAPASNVVQDRMNGPVGGEFNKSMHVSRTAPR